MAEDALTVVALRNEYYKVGQRKVILALFIALIVNFALTAMLIYLVTNPPAPKYFATGINGRIMPVFTLAQPNLSDDAVLQWASKAAIAAFTYNFVNYRSELQASSEFFTPEGWDQFLNALQQSNNLDAVKARKFVVSAAVTQQPTILKSGVEEGVFSWHIKMPLLITYQSATEGAQQNNIVSMVVTRVSTLNTPRGIGISQFVVGPANGGGS